MFNSGQLWRQRLHQCRVNTVIISNWSRHSICRECLRGSCVPDDGSGGGGGGGVRPLAADRRELSRWICKYIASSSQKQKIMLVQINIQHEQGNDLTIKKKL